MTSAAANLVKNAVELRESGRLDEAIVVAERATRVDPDDANSWWQLGLATAEKIGAEAAIPYFEKTVELANQFAYGWHRLGMAYKETDRLDDAINSWEKAVELDDDRVDSLDKLADAYGERKFDGDEEKRFEVLKLLDEKGEIAPLDLNTLGNAYYKNKDFHKAIRCYRRYADHDSGPVGYFNLGLALFSPEVGQDADAVDAWRRALARDATYERAKTQLSKALPRLLALQKRVLANKAPLVGQDQWYANYINPFELLNLIDIDDPFGLDVKTIQRAKKALFQEIELEDGRVEWCPGLHIDKSQAIKVSDELTDEDSRYWHHLVYESKPLLEFLSRGKLDHFLVDEVEPSIDTLDMIEKFPGEFEQLIGARFATQFDLLLTKAIEKREVDYIECLLHGRRWVSPGHEDKCFEGAMRQTERLLEPLNKAADRFEKVKPSLEAVRAELAQGNAGRILAMLPSTFQTVQSKATALIRSISISAYNDHSDADLAKEILALSRPLAAKSPSLLHRIDEDTKILDERIKNESKDEAFLTYQGASYSITRKAVIFGDQILLVKDVSTIRWGITVSRAGTVTTHAYSFAVGGKGAKVLLLSWSAYEKLDAQMALFNKFTNAAFAYLMPRIVEIIKKDLDDNQTVRIGVAPVSKDGITFTIEGWFSSKQETCPWRRLRSEIDNGEVVITDSSNSKCKISLPLITVDNAIPLHLLIQNTS